MPSLLRLQHSTSPPTPAVDSIAFAGQPLRHTPQTGGWSGRPKKADGAAARAHSCRHSTSSICSSDAIFPFLSCAAAATTGSSRQTSTGKDISQRNGRWRRCDRVMTRLHLRPGDLALVVERGYVRKEVRYRRLGRRARRVPDNLLSEFLSEACRDGGSVSSEAEVMVQLSSHAPGPSFRANNKGSKKAELWECTDVPHIPLCSVALSSPLRAPSSGFRCCLSSARVSDGHRL